MTIVDTTRDNPVTEVPSPVLAPPTAAVAVAPRAVVTTRRSRAVRFLAALAHSGTLNRRGFGDFDRGAFQEYLASAQRANLR